MLYSNQVIMVYTEESGNVIFQHEGVEIAISKSKIYDSIARSLQRSLTGLRIDIEDSSYPIEIEHEYFLAHKSEFVDKYKDRYIVINGRQVVADYANENEAYKWGEMEYGSGKYIVKFCSPYSEKCMKYGRA